jgi:hypothetical protein
MSVRLRSSRAVPAATQTQTNQPIIPSALRTRPGLGKKGKGEGESALIESKQRLPSRFERLEDLPCDAEVHLLERVGLDSPAFGDDDELLGNEAVFVQLITVRRREGRKEVRCRGKEGS